MIFAAGLGTRLRPLTDHMPKALVPVAGKPMLERVILRLKEAGFNEITVNIHHFGEQIIDFLRAHDNFGTEIHISDERGMLLDTGGGIKKARPFLDGQEPFLVHNVDILKDQNYDYIVTPTNREQLDEMVELMVETVCSNRENVRVCGNDLPQAVVKSRLLKLDGSHIRYVFECL